MINSNDSGEFSFSSHKRKTGAKKSLGEKLIFLLERKSLYIYKHNNKCCLTALMEKESCRKILNIILQYIIRSVALSKFKSHEDLVEGGTYNMKIAPSTLRNDNDRFQ